MIHLPFCSRTIQKQLEKRMTQYLHWKFDIESEFVGKQKLESLNSKAKLTSNETKEDLRQYGSRLETLWTWNSVLSNDLQHVLMAPKIYITHW